MSQNKSTPIGVETNRVGVHLDVSAWMNALNTLKEQAVGHPEKEQNLEERRYELWPHLADPVGRVRFRVSTGWTGRMSTATPCIHGIDKGMRAGIATPGKLILTADWKACHPRILALRSGDKHLRADLIDGDPYIALAREVIDAPTPEHRKAVKAAVNARLNGCGYATVGEMLRNVGIEVAPAKLVEKMEARWATAFKHLAEVRRKAVQNGWKIDLGDGVTIEVPKDKRTEHRITAAYLQGIEAQALRRVIQKSRKVEEKVGARLLFSAHDETVWEVDPAKMDVAAKLIGRLMGRAMLGEDELATGAVELSGVLDPRAQRSRTSAALETDQGVVIGGGGRDLNPAQRATAKPGETLSKSPGDHAEITTLKQADDMGANPKSIGASRKFCDDCKAEIESRGGTLTSDRTAEFD